MKQLIEKVLDALTDAGLVEVEVSARHVHLTQEHVETLFGPGSRSDCVALGVKAPIRESGDVKGSAPMTIVGPEGTIEISEGTIIAHNHIHVPEETAKRLRLADKERVSVRVLTDRPVVFEDVIIRVSDRFTFKMHVDFDEANAAEVSGFTLGQIIRH